MTALISALTFAVASLLYGAASALFYMDVARATSVRRAPTPRAGVAPPSNPAPASRAHMASSLLAAAALGHAAYVALASFVAHVCPIHSVHFLLSVASLFASA